MAVLARLASEVREPPDSGRGINSSILPLPFSYYNFPLQMHHDDVLRRANVRTFCSRVEHKKLHENPVCRIRLIGEAPSDDQRCPNMCQCQQATYDPYLYPDPMGCPYCAQSVYAVPYPSYSLTYDPYWPSRVTPSTHPLAFYPPPSRRRFRGEIRLGNCLLIYE